MPALYTVVVPAFFAIFIGFIFGKFWKPDMRTVVDVALYIGVPALVFTSLLEKQVDLLDAARVWSAALAVQIGCGLAAFLVFKALRQRHSGLYVPIAIMNTVNLPFPILYLAYGAAALVPATLFYIPNVLLAFSAGIYIMSGGNKAALKEVLRQPVIYAAILGLILSLTKVTVPDLVLHSLDLVAQVTIPLVLIVLGYNLSKVRVTAFRTTLLASFLRMGVGLGLGVLLAWALGLTGLTRSVVILVSAMPAAANSSILAAKYDNEAEQVSSVVFLTTVAALGVIPLLLHFFG
jgi:predicted permease